LNDCSHTSILLCSRGNSLRNYRARVEYTTVPWSMLLTIYKMSKYSILYRFFLIILFFGGSSLLWTCIV